MHSVKDALVTCARDQLTEGGLSGFSLRKVAACAGVTPTAVYRHFTDREELLQTVIVTGFQLFTSFISVAADRSSLPRERLFHATEGYLQFALQQRAYYEIMFMSTNLMTGLTRITAEGARETQEAFTLLEDIVADCMVDGGTPHNVAVDIWAHCHGLISLYFTGKITENEQEFVEIYRSVIERSIATL